MSKYQLLWEHVRETGQEKLVLSFEEIGQIVGVSLDHSFLNSKKELLAYGYRVGKISMKAQTVEFVKQEEADHDSHI